MTHTRKKMKMSSSLSKCIIPKKIEKDQMNFGNDVGCVNPKTLRPPKIAPHSHDVKVWVKDGIHSQTNNSRLSLTTNYSEEDINHMYCGNLLQEEGSDISRRKDSLSSILKKIKDERLVNPRIGSLCTEHRIQSTSVDAIRSTPGGLRSSNELYMTRRRGKTHPHEIEYPAFKGTNLEGGRCDDNALLMKLRVPNSSTLKSNLMAHGSREQDDWGYNIKGQDNIPGYYYNRFDQNKDGIPSFGGPTLPSNLNLSDYEVDKRFDGHNRELHTQTIQPSHYSINSYSEPINANLGISRTPSLEPISTNVDRRYNPELVYYQRVDPQLVRDDEPLNRLRENPPRLGWSKQLPLEPTDKGTVKIEDVYDPRFTSHGSDNRSYLDVMTGQIRYYYGDIDAHRRPNFIGRSKVDHVDYLDPMGAIKPEYHRRIIAKNYKKLAEDQYHRDALYHRENMMESLMRKRNSERWQTRAFPHTNTASKACNFVK